MCHPLPHQRLHAKTIPDVFLFLIHLEDSLSYDQPSGCLGGWCNVQPKIYIGASEPRTACFSLKRSTLKAIFFPFPNIWLTCQKWNMPNNHITHKGEWDLVPFTMTIHSLVFCHSWGVNMINDTDVANTSCVFFSYSYFSTHVIQFLWLV